MNTCTCLGCNITTATEDLTAGLCPECAVRYMDARSAGHDDACGCDECDFVARVGVARVRALAPDAAGPAGLPRYVREALARKAARPAPYIPRCSTGECACGCDYLVGFPF